MGEEDQKNDVEEDALNRAVLDRLIEMQRAAQVDCASQCEDPVKEAELLTLKRKLRVKKRKIFTAQSMTNMAENGTNRPLLPAHTLPNQSHTNPYKLNRYRTSSISLLLIRFCCLRCSFLNDRNRTNLNQICFLE